MANKIRLHEKSKSATPFHKFPCTVLATPSFASMPKLMLLHSSCVKISIKCAEICNDMNVDVTFEGDNTVMMQQVGHAETALACFLVQLLRLLCNIIT